MLSKVGSKVSQAIFSFIAQWQETWDSISKTWMHFQNLQVFYHLLAGKQMNYAVWIETHLYLELYNVIIVVI